MKTTRSMLTIAALLLGYFIGSNVAAQQGQATVAQNSPDTVVANLYRQHKRQSPFFQTRNRALIDKYFEKSLGDLIWKDAVRSKGEVGLLDGDPLFNAQDMEIKNFAVHQPVMANGQAEVTVSFENFGKKEKVVFVLVSRRSGWKIANLKYSDGTDLAGILKGDATAARPETQEIKVFLVAVGDKGKMGKRIGCDDSLVPVARRSSLPLLR